MPVAVFSETRFPSPLGESIELNPMLLKSFAYEAFKVRLRRDTEIFSHISLHIALIKLTKTKFGNAAQNTCFYPTSQCKNKPFLAIKL
jgi:hypothetical protein